MCWGGYVYGGDLRASEDKAGYSGAPESGVVEAFDNDVGADAGGETTEERAYRDDGDVPELGVGDSVLWGRRQC